MTDDMADDELDDDFGDESVAETEQEIHSGGMLASTFQIQRAAILTTFGTRATRRCTATVIGPSHVLMSARCNPQIGETILFYTSTLANEASDREIIDVDYPPGVNPASGDYHDSNNIYANLAIVRLEAPAPTTSLAATLSWRYPGNNSTGTKVGAGEHQPVVTATTLRQVNDTTESASDNNGNFWTHNQHTNTGDGGGPFYSGSRVLGVFDTYVWEWVYRDQYTSVPESLNWILSQIGFTWNHLRYTFWRISAGTILEQFTVESENQCQYACEKTSSCGGYSYRRNDPYCRLYAPGFSVAESSYDNFGRK
ncbi:MAG TPA: PAN domain-containing protein [Kofleriaceae bacterium]